MLNQLVAFVYRKFLSEGLQSRSMEPPNIQFLRERILTALLFVCSTVSIPAILVSLVKQIPTGQWTAATMGVFLYLVYPTVFVFRNRLAYQTKAIIGVGAIIVFSTINLALYGIDSVAIWTMLATCVCATVLLGSKAGLKTILICALCIAVVGLLVISGTMEIKYLSRGENAYSASWWLLVIFSFIMLGLMVVLSPGVVEHYLVQALHAVGERENELRKTNESLWVEIAERKQAEQEKKVLVDQLSQAQKLEALGKLAGFVAHDFNNILMAIKGYCELLTDDFEPGSSTRDDLDEINMAADRATALTGQLLAFSRKQVISPSIVNLNEIIRKSGKLLGRLVGEDIKIDYNLEEDLQYIKFDPHQIDQIIINLAVNARDAMPQGGAIQISTRSKIMTKEDREKNPDICEGGYVVLKFRDTGEGMDEQTQSRIFEPFFSTKDEGRGTGLGLATVREIVKKNKGSISVTSKKNQGTIFEVLIPQEKTHSQISSVPPLPTMPARNETVLLVEDEEMVRVLVERMLDQLGYIVLTARDGERAIDTVKTHTGNIDLLLTDVIMPNMTGQVLKEKVATLNPRIRVLFMSGYTSDILSRQGIREDETHIIDKPFTIKHLSRRIREILEQRSV